MSDICLIYRPLKKTEKQLKIAKDQSNTFYRRKNPEKR